MDPEAEVSLLLVGTTLSRRYNKAHRGVDRATDVLSFPLLEQEDQSWGFGEQAPWLGDIVICLPVAQRQAACNGLTLTTELTVLLVHGLMHLLGHDHVKADQARAMAELEMSVLASLAVAPEVALVGRALLE